MTHHRGLGLGHSVRLNQGHVCARTARSYGHRRLSE
jgi:hypothetical protein